MWQSLIRELSAALEASILVLAIVVFSMFAYWLWLKRPLRLARLRRLRYKQGRTPTLLAPPLRFGSNKRSRREKS